MHLSSAIRGEGGHGQGRGLVKLPLVSANPSPNPHVRLEEDVERLKLSALTTKIIS